MYGSAEQCWVTSGAAREVEKLFKVSLKLKAKGTIKQRKLRKCRKFDSGWSLAARTHPQNEYTKLCQLIARDLRKEKKLF